MNRLRSLLTAMGAMAMLSLAHAQQAGTISFNVPYQFKQIAPDYTSFRIVCGVSANGEALGSGFTPELPLDAGGSAQGTAEVVVKPNIGKSLAGGTDWQCEVGFSRKGVNTPHHASTVGKPGVPNVGEVKGRF
jgi:hypothetical protein